MNLLSFKNFFSKLSAQESKSSIHETSTLSDKFSFYLTNDKKLALSMMVNGFQPNNSQVKILNSALSKEAITNVNFLSNYSTFIEFIPTQAFSNFITHHDLSLKCSNDKTIYSNFASCFVQLKSRQDFSIILKKVLVQSISAHCQKSLNIKPRYEQMYAFEFNQEDNRTYKFFTKNIYNTLVLLPILINDMSDFVIIKKTVNDNISLIKEYIQKHNVKIRYNGKIYHYHENNCALFKVELLDSWNKHLSDYNTTTLQKALLEETRLFTKDKTSHNNQINIIEADPIHEITQKIVQLQTELDSDSVHNITNVVQLYEKIQQGFDYCAPYEVDSLYKDLLISIEKFISIETPYRQTLKNIEDKTPHELLQSAITQIETQFISYVTEINQSKVTDLSIQHRKIKMKT